MFTLIYYNTISDLHYPNPEGRDYLYHLATPTRMLILTAAFVASVLLHDVFEHGKDISARPGEKLRISERVGLFFQSTIAIALLIPWDILGLAHLTSVAAGLACLLCTVNVVRTRNILGHTVSGLLSLVILASRLSTTP